jgi:hypothetical protein
MGTMLRQETRDGDRGSISRHVASAGTNTYLGGLHGSVAVILPCAVLLGTQPWPFNRVHMHSLGRIVDADLFALTGGAAAVPAASNPPACTAPWWLSVDQANSKLSTCVWTRLQSHRLASPLFLSWLYEPLQQHNGSKCR